MAWPPAARDCDILISPRAHARICSIARRGRGSEGCTDSKRCRTCSAHAAAHKARSRWSESVSVPPRRMVMKRGSRSFGRITVPPFRSERTARVTQVAPRTQAHMVGGYSCAMQFKDPNAVELRVALLDIEPTIWRRLVVPWTFHLGQLHHVIQAAFGWLDYHLHQFLIGGLRYGDFEQIGEPEFVGEPRGFDQTEVRLLDFGHHEPVSFV